VVFGYIIHNKQPFATMTYDFKKENAILKINDTIILHFKGIILRENREEEITQNRIDKLFWRLSSIPTNSFLFSCGCSFTLKECAPDSSEHCYKN